MSLCLIHVNANKNFRQECICVLSVLFNRPTFPELILKACPHCRRKVRQSPNFAVVSPFSATVALFCDSVDRALDWISSPREKFWRLLQQVFESRMSFLLPNQQRRST